MQKLANSDPNYLVTAGDTYILTYAGNLGVITQLINIDNTYKVYISNLGTINAERMTYFAFKEQIERLVQRNFPFGSPQLVLRDTGLFKVNVNGEVAKTADIEAWGLSRLEDLIGKVGMTSYSSIRNIIVTSKNKKKKEYDLFRWYRDADDGQNPYLRPGDTITVQRKNRSVVISGAVERPGTYELLKGENLKALVNLYGGGLEILADEDRIQITRISGSSSLTGDKLFLEKSDLTNDYVLNNYDVVYIPSLKDQSPVFFIEGAIVVENFAQASIAKSTGNGDDAATTEEKTINVLPRFPVVFGQGDTYNDLILRNKAWFSDISDVKNAYIIRTNARIPIDLGKILYDGPGTDKIIIERNDTLMVPYRQYVIHVEGEVAASKVLTVLSLTRLAGIVDNLGLTEFSSRRNIIITSENGLKNEYDLFRWYRDADDGQNPYLRPGDTITVQRKNRSVVISGAVERPGTYELLKGENLKALVNLYGGGLKILADNNSIELVRSLDNNTGDIQDKIFLTKEDVDKDYELYDYDVVYISSLTDVRLVFYVEGAVAANRGGEAAIVTQEENVSTRFAVDFIEGDTYNSLLRKHAAWFSDVSDLKKSYITRGTERIPLNIDRILYDSNYTVETKIEKEDDLMVPFKQYFVTVGGAVYAPGRYPFIPDRTWDYYVGLAGGLIPEKNSRESVKIETSDKVKLKKSDFILPETSIFARSNSFLYYFNQYAPIITTFLSIATTTLSIWAIAGR